MGRRKWLGGLHGNVLCVGEVKALCVGDGGRGVLELELSRGCSLGGGEGCVGLLIRDDGHIIGRKPSTLLTKQTVPPARFQPGEDLDDVVSTEREGRVVIGLVVKEGAAEKGREELLLLLLGGLGSKRHGLCSRVEDFSGHGETRRLALWWLAKPSRQLADNFPARMAVLEAYTYGDQLPKERDAIRIHT